MKTHYPRFPVSFLQRPASPIKAACNTPGFVPLPICLLALLFLNVPTLAATAPSFADRIAGAHHSFAIGDGMAGEWERWSTPRIAAHFGTGDFTAFTPPLKKRPPGRPGKGDGRITDDTLEVEALMRTYAAHNDHLDAYDYAIHFIPEIAARPVWIPERGAEGPILERPLWWPERYAYHRHAINHTEPRKAGEGNWLNQGLAAFIWPVGAVHAGDPAGAYLEAVSFGSAHTESYALEGAAVIAAAYAAAFGADPSVEKVLAAAQTLARDGTALALRAVLASVDPHDDVVTFAGKARAAWLPYSGLPIDRIAAGETDTTNRDGTNVGLPSRIQSLESVPAALAALAWSEGDWNRAFRAGLLYGEDAETIAALAVGLVGAMRGSEVIPPQLAADSDLVNQRDFAAAGREFAAVVERILASDATRLASRQMSVRP